MIDLPKPENIESWVRVVENLASRLTTKKGRSRKRRLADLSAIVTAILPIHENYVSIFIRFLNGVMESDSWVDVEVARGEFLRQRREYSADRALLAFSVDSLTSPNSTPEEVKFLMSVSRYISDSSIGSAIGSSRTYSSFSMGFWQGIEKVDERELLVDYIQDAIEELRENYMNMVAVARELEIEPSVSRQLLNRGLK